VRRRQGGERERAANKTPLGPAADERWKVMRSFLASFLPLSVSVFLFSSTRKSKPFLCTSQ
jgi:hypothetical protein